VLKEELRLALARLEMLELNVFASPQSLEFEFDVCSVNVPPQPQRVLVPGAALPAAIAAEAPAAPQDFPLQSPFPRTSTPRNGNKKLNTEPGSSAWEPTCARLVQRDPALYTQLGLRTAIRCS
jgi:hypothetical protein